MTGVVLKLWPALLLALAAIAAAVTAAVLTIGPAPTALLAAAALLWLSADALADRLNHPKD
jgi:hypothetical protein